MTGFRIGCVFGPEAVVKAIANVQSETTGCPNALSQAGWEAALLEEPPEVDGWVSSFKARRDLLIMRPARPRHGVRDAGWRLLRLPPWPRSWTSAARPASATTSSSPSSS